MLPQIVAKQGAHDGATREGEKCTAGGGYLFNRGSAEEKQGNPLTLSLEKAFARWRESWGGVCGMAPGAGVGVETVEARPGERWAPLAVGMQRTNKGRTKANRPCYRSRMRWQWGRWCIAYLTAPEACSVCFFRRERCGRRRARGTPRRRQEGERAGRVVCRGCLVGERIDRRRHINKIHI